MTDLTTYFLTTDQKRLTLIAWYEILGGLWSLLGFVWAAWQEPSSQTLRTLAVSSLLNGFVIYAGIQLLQTTRIKTSIVAQTMQILNFSGLGITFYFVSGLSVCVGFEWIEQPNFILNYDVISAFKLRYSNKDFDAIRLTFNLIPMLVIYYFLRLEERAAHRQQLAQPSLIDATD